MKKKGTNKKKGYKISPALEKGLRCVGLPVPPFNPHEKSRKQISKKNLRED